MRVVLKDLSQESSRRVKSILTGLCDECEGGGLVLIGHGSNKGDEFMNVTPKQILECGIRPAVIWLFACNCGRTMLEGLSDGGPMAIGHVCNVLISKDDPRAVQAVIQTMEESAAHTDCHGLTYTVREKWLSIAKQCFFTGDFFTAAVVNQLRLSLRCKSGSKL